MSSNSNGATLVLSTVAVCLLLYVMKREYSDGQSGERFEAALGAISSFLGSKNQPDIDCSGINPGHANWARCAQGSAKGRVPTKVPVSVLKNTSLDFASESIRNQGLGVGRLQDGFVHDQYSSSLGTPRPGGMRIDKSNLKNNSFFSPGTQNATSLVTSGISTEGAAAFPFASKSSSKREDVSPTRRRASGDVAGTEPVGMGMNFNDFKRKISRAMSQGDDGVGGGGRSASRHQVDKKLGVAPFEEQGANFNPFAGGSSPDLGGGLKLSEAYDAPKLGMGSNLSSAFGSLGAAVSPISSSDVGVSPVEISAATAALSGINIVQSTGGGHIDRFIRP